MRKEILQIQMPCNAEARFEEYEIKVISDSFIYLFTHPKAVIEVFLFNCAVRTRCPGYGKFTVNTGYYRGSTKPTLPSESFCVLVPLNVAAVHASPVIWE